LGVRNDDRSLTSESFEPGRIIPESSGITLDDPQIMDIEPLYEFVGMTLTDAPCLRPA
jgi:hypothetical protein